MEALLEASRMAIDQITANPWMTSAEKDVAHERLQKLKLRVGVPKQLVDYAPLALTTNYKRMRSTSLGLALSLAMK